MSCDRRRAKFIEHILAVGPPSAATPSASALERTFQNSCLPPRSAAERLTNEAKVQALFQVFGRIGVDRPTHSKSGLPATDALCAGYARLYDELARRGQFELLSGALSSSGQPQGRGAPQQLRAPSADAVAVQVAGAALKVTGGRLAEMLVAIKSLAGSAYQSGSKTWSVPGSRTDFDALLRARGWSCDAAAASTASADIPPPAIAPAGEPPAEYASLADQPEQGVSAASSRSLPVAPQTTDPPPARGAVQVSSPDQHAQNEHLKALRMTHTRRLRVMELQLARLGENYAPPHLVLEIADTVAALHELDQQIEAFQQPPRVLESKRALVGLAQQRVIMQAIADIIGVPASEIELIDIVLGSIILTVELSLAAAAQLIALHQARHPRLAQMRLAGVELLAAEDSFHQPAEAALLGGTEDLYSQMIAALPADEQAFQLLSSALQGASGARPDQLGSAAPHALPAGIARLCLTLATEADQPEPAV